MLIVAWVLASSQPTLGHETRERTDNDGHVKQDTVQLPPEQRHNATVPHGNCIIEKKTLGSQSLPRSITVIS